MKNYITLFLLIFSLGFYAQTTPGEYTINNVKVNTKQSDFGTSFFGKNKVVFAAPRSNAVITRSTWSGNNQAFLDLYIATITHDGELEDKKTIVGDVNNRFHEGIVTFTKDMKTVYFSANNYTESNKAKKDSTGTVNIQLYKAEVHADGEWKNVIKLPFNSDEFSTGHPALSTDDKRLYFVSDRPETIGKTDIFYVDIKEDGTYGEPINLGPKINTTEREMFPFISDENILYFSSNGHEGFGELDVFASRIFENTLSEPINLQTPVNSEKDDFSFIIDDSKHKGFFSSNREGGKGDDDIYGFYAFPPLKIEGNQVVTGVIRDMKTGELIAGATVILQDLEGNEIERVELAKDMIQGWRPFINDVHSLDKDKIQVTVGDIEKISISKTVDNEDPNEGEEVEFTIQIKNEGTVTAQNVHVSDILPEGYTYVSDDAGETEEAAFANNNISLKEIPNGQTKTIKVKARVNTHWKPFTNEDTTIARDKLLVQKGDAENIQIIKSVDNESPAEGEEVEFTVQIKNLGTLDAENLKVTDILPMGYTYVSDNTSKKEGTAFKNNTVSVKELFNGEVKTIKVKAIVNEGWKPYTNQDERVPVEQIIYLKGDIEKVSITKTVDNENPAEGEEVEFTVTFKNEGTLDVEGLSVYGVLPDGYMYISDNTSSVEGASFEDNLLALKRLPNGTTKTLKIKAKVYANWKAYSNKEKQVTPDKILAQTGDIEKISITKTVDNESPTEGQEVEFTIQLKNLGTIDAKNIKVSDILPEGYSYVSDDAGKTKGAMYLNDIISVASLEKGEVKTIKVKAKVVPKEDTSGFKFEVASNKEYKIVVKAPGYLPEQVSFKTSNETDVRLMELPINLSEELRIVDEKIMVNINTIYFDFDKSNIRSDAARELDKVIAIMKDHPSMIIEAGSHTDSRATERYNQKLSQRRAQSTVDYIVAGGIDKDRITAKGYGEMQLVNNCSSFVKCTREEHQLNRRTEFVIINDNDKIISKAATLKDVIVGDDNMTHVKRGAKETVKKPENDEDSLPTQLETVEEGLTSESNIAASYIQIPPIYFDFDSWSLSAKELKQLDNVVNIMKSNPSLKIEAGAHTDAKNREAYNLLLSQKRAKTVVDYIVAQGIDPSRITGKGYGESRLTNHCRSFVKCSPEEQQENRRIEFMIISGNGYPDQEFLEKENAKFIHTNPIYFDNDKFDIRKDAAYELDRVIQIMKDNPTMIIEAASHTDAKNTEAYNRVLSEKRAKSTKEYMVKRGIDPSRIKTVGYGEMKLTNHCKSFVKCTPEEHQANRRTEFKIVNM